MADGFDLTSPCDRSTLGLIFQVEGKFKRFGHLEVVDFGDLRLGEFVPSDGLVICIHYFPDALENRPNQPYQVSKCSIGCHICIKFHKVWFWTVLGVPKGCHKRIFVCVLVWEFWKLSLVYSLGRATRTRRVNEASDIPRVVEPYPMVFLSVFESQNKVNDVSKCHAILALS